MGQLSDRKQKILEAIIQDHLNTAEPVGSRQISRGYRLGVSPATIRNEMSDLEDDGYILQPHTSAGRIPSDKGYRYYVDNLMRSAGLSPTEQELITGAYSGVSEDMETVARHTISILSSLSHYAAIMMSSDDKIYHWGISKIASQPEFNDIDQLKSFARLFEEDDLLSSVLRECAECEGVTIRIGSENRHREMRKYSIVTASYNPRGSLGIIGPTRMFYGKAASIVKFIAEQLGGRA